MNTPAAFADLLFNIAKLQNAMHAPDTYRKCEFCNGGCKFCGYTGRILTEERREP